MYKVFIQNNSLSFIDSNQINDFNGIFLFEQFAMAQKDYVLSLVSLPNPNSNFYIVSEKPIQAMSDFFNTYERVEAAGGIVVCQSKVLIMKRNGIWDLPKGKVDSGESLESAAIREVEEETGISNLKIDQKLINTFHTYSTYGPDSIKKTAWFLMETTDFGTLVPQLEEGITEVVWAKSEELDTYFADSYASLKEVIKSYQNL